MIVGEKGLKIRLMKFTRLLEFSSAVKEIFLLHLCPFLHNYLELFSGIEKIYIFKSTLSRRSFRACSLCPLKSSTSTSRALISPFCSFWSFRIASNAFEYLYAQQLSTEYFCPFTSWQFTAWKRRSHRIFLSEPLVRPIPCAERAHLILFQLV